MHLPVSSAVRWSRLKVWTHNSAFLAVVACLLALAAANISLRASWGELEDGVLWAGRPEGVIAAEVGRQTAGALAGVEPGDLLIAIDGRAVETPEQVLDVLHSARPGARLEYTLVRAGEPRLLRLTLLPVPAGNRTLYFVLAAVAIFTLLVGSSVRVRRPNDEASLHFFWLCVAFFGVFAFSFSGRLDRLDWVFYWADVVAMLMLPPLFLHFALVFPERAMARTPSGAGRLVLPLLYAPAAALGLGRALVVSRVFGEGRFVSVALSTIDRVEMLYLAAGLVAGFAVMLRGLRRTATMTAQRQLRWIVWGTALGALPFVVFYVLPFAAGLDPLPNVELLAVPLGLVPLAFASAVVRYRLMDVEVIVKRAISYAFVISAIAAIYAVILKLATEVFLGGTDQHHTVIAVLATLVVVLLAPMVKNAIQTTLDRAHYRDRYDYRRALVGFARDLNSELDPQRLSRRLVERVRATLVLDRMALLVASADGAGWEPIYAEGFSQAPQWHLALASGIGGRLEDGHLVSLEDPFGARRFAHAEVTLWRERGAHYFVPCVSNDRTIAVMVLGARESGEPLNSEDLALMAGIAGQVATALENGRLYSELRVKADELNRLREFSENIIASLNDGLLVVGLDGRIVRWNPALEQFYGLSRAQAVGRRIEDVFSGQFLAGLQAAMSAEGGAGTLYRVPVESRHEPPVALLVNAAVAPLRTPDGQVAGTIVIVEDTTARVKLEEQLQISEKMASIGLLAAGVAHEVNTPLTGISSYTQMLLEQAEPGDPRTQLLEKIERQTFRAAKIVNGLLNLARPAKSDFGPVDLNAAINDVISLVEHQLRAANIQVRRQLSQTPPIVLGVEHKLQQVLLNLFLNARDAMPKGGWLSITTRVEDGQVVVEVGDTGAGIPQEDLSRIYDPFFTTKPIGQGTGLGLSITYGIVDEHDGTITCESTPGQGTRFRVTFPAASPSRAVSSRSAK